MDLIKATKWGGLSLGFVEATQKQLPFCPPLLGQKKVSIQTRLRQQNTVIIPWLHSSFLEVAIRQLETWHSLLESCYVAEGQNNPFCFTNVCTTFWKSLGPDGIIPKAATMFPAAKLYSGSCKYYHRFLNCITWLF